MAKIRESSAKSLSHLVSAEIEFWPELRARMVDSCSPEDVHDLRVSIRKIRTAILLSLNENDAEVQRIQDHLRVAFRLLGCVRDLDIAATTLCGSSVETSLSIQGELLHARSVATSHLSFLLAKHLVLDEVIEWARGLNTKDVVKSPVSGYQQVRRARKQVQSCFRRANVSNDLADIHKLRRRVKRLRYTVEFTGVGDKYVHRLSRLQDKLGRIIDGVSTISVLKGLESTTHSNELENLVEHLDKQIRKQSKSINGLKPCIKGKLWTTLSKKLKRSDAALVAQVIQF